MSLLNRLSATISRSAVCTASVRDLAPRIRAASSASCVSSRIEVIVTAKTRLPGTLYIQDIGCVYTAVQWRNRLELFWIKTGSGLWQHHIAQIIAQLVPRIQRRQSEVLLDEPQDGDIIHLNMRDKSLFGKRRDDQHGDTRSEALVV
jgi:hypothetical protein